MAAVRSAAPRPPSGERREAASLDSIRRHVVGRQVALRKDRNIWHGHLFCGIEAMSRHSTLLDVQACTLPPGRLFEIPRALADTSNETRSRSVCAFRVLATDQ
jgi:hypothetical protein